jgi:aryl-alcohol dehydrogenase-like predicted oxidoreductase
MKSCDASLEALGVETITVYQLHTVDPRIPIEESIGALAELKRLGKIAQIGVSNVDVNQLERARSVAPIVSVQNHYSPALSIEDPVLARCEELDIAFLPWGPLTGFRGRPDGPESPAAARFTDAAARLGLSPARLVLAWELAYSPVMIPIPGSTRIASITDSAGAAAESLDPALVAWLSGAGPAPFGAGD